MNFVISVAHMSGKSEARNVVMEESKFGSQNSDDTLVVLEFSPKAPAETKEWLTALIKAPGVFLINIKICMSTESQVAYQAGA